MDDLPDNPAPVTPRNEESLPKCPSDTTESKPICFVDAAHGNNPTKRQSTTGHAVTCGGGAVLCQSKAQSATALSSTKAESTAAVTAAKNIKFVRSALNELGLPMEEPTPICEDDQSAMEIINANKPTGRSRHTDTQFFAIQGWKDDGHITMKHMPGVINPADDLTKPLGCVPHSRHAGCMMGHRHLPKDAGLINAVDG